MNSSFLYLIEEMTGTVVEYSMKTYNSDLPKIEEFVQLNGKTLLEVGCGDGRLTALLASKVEAILGNKNNGEPIIIKDIVNIFLLGKYPDEAGRDTGGGWRSDCISGVGRVHLHYGADDRHRRWQHHPGI
jgi:hypothetical protein